MQRTCRFVPMAAVQVETILWNTCEVDDTEQGTMAWPIRIVRSRFTQVVEARPHELTNAIRQIFMLDKVVFRQVGPTAMFHVVARTLVVVIFSHRLPFDREFINAAGAYRRGGFAT